MEHLLKKIVSIMYVELTQEMDQVGTVGKKMGWCSHSLVEFMEWHHMLCTSVGIITYVYCGECLSCLSLILPFDPTIPPFIMRLLTLSY